MKSLPLARRCRAESSRAVGRAGRCSASGLSKDEVDRMVKDAQSHAADDQKRREVIDARNQADSLAYSVEKTITENREKLSSQDVARIEASIAEVRQAAQAENLAAIKTA